MSWVLDASVALRWVLTEERHPNAERVLERIVTEPALFAVPELFAFEVFAVLARVHPEPEAAYREAILPILSGGSLRCPMTEAIAARAADLLQHGLTGYDACYAALARELGGVWLTFDRKAHALLADEELSVDLWSGLPAAW